MENGIDITVALTKLFYCRRPQAYLLRLDDNLTAVEMTRSMESQSRREKKTLGHAGGEERNVYHVETQVT